MGLFDPFSLGPLQLKNRLVMTAMSTRLAGPRGQVTEALTAYYERRAAGGVGMVTVEEASVHPQLPHVRNGLGVYGEALTAGLSNLTDRIHLAGAKASLQIGLYFRQQLNGFPRYAVSLRSPDYAPDCRELTKDEIRYLTGLFGDAAARTRRAGFDAVEVHACHGCLVSEFLSPFWNRRTDEYGGTPGRFRFALEILDAIRSAVGPDYPVLFRISGSEFYEGGLTPEDGRALSVALEAHGVTAINVSGGLGHVNHIAIPPSDVPRGILLPLAAGIRKVVNVPILVGNSLTPEMAEQALLDGSADLIGLGRPLIADPDWPLKVKQGRLNEIRSCIRCNQGCFAMLRDQGLSAVTCMYNPQAGREMVRTIVPAERKRTVAVIGGGPAGCETARVARLRGHEVTLFEKEGRLGGQFNLASVPPKKQDFALLVKFYENELPRLGVTVRLETEVTPELLDTLKADVFVLATGSLPIVPRLPGVNLPHVVTAHRVLSGEVQAGSGPVVVIGAGATGLETADFLSEKGKTVTVVEMLDAPGRDIAPGIGVRESLLARLAEKKVSILTGHRAMSIEPNAVIVSDRPLNGGGDEKRIPADLVVLGLGGRPESEVAQCAMGAPGLRLHVGDCDCPGNALSAIHQAFELAVCL